MKLMVIRALVYIGLCIVVFQANAAKAAEVVSLITRPGVKQKFILIKPDQPVAAVILFAGGDGTLNLSSFLGAINIHTGYAQNFVVRTRNEFARQGFIVAVVDAPSDNTNGINPVFRMSSEHAEDIKAVISYLKGQAAVPIWLIGTSMGTFSALSVAIFLKERIDGVVVTSSVTRSAKKWHIHRSHPWGVLSMELEEIKVPTLVVSHRDDQCNLTPVSDSPKLVKRLFNARKVEVIYFEGGDQPRSGPCDALSAHGFWGIENKVVEAIADFIKAASK